MTPDPERKMRFSDDVCTFAGIVVENYCERELRTNDLRWDVKTGRGTSQMPILKMPSHACGRQRNRGRAVPVPTLASTTGTIRALENFFKRNVAIES